MNLSNKYLKAWLSFNTSPTEDALLNQWTTYGNPTIGTANAFNGKALQLDGSSYIKLAGIQLGGQNFYIDGWIYVDSSSPANARILHIVNPSTGCSLVSIRKNSSDATKLDFWANSYADVSQDYGYTYVSSINSVGTRVHFKLIYRYSDNRLSFCIDDKIAADWTSKATQYNRQTVDIYIGALPNGNQGLIGTVDELRIYDGTWFSYNYGTPPTLDDYQQITFTADIERKITNAALTWRYENPGDADDLIVASTVLTDLPATQSATGTAFYQTQRVKCFDLAATPEVWMKFDVYFDGSNRWRAYNGATNLNSGVCVESGNFCYFVNQGDSYHQQFTNVQKTNTLQTVLLHMISGSTAGVIEAWVDGSKIYTYTGDVNHGSDFADIYLQSDGSGTFFSNVIISNAEIGLGEGWHLITFDFQRKLSNRVEVVFDVERTILQVINVPFIFGEHFNHYVSYISSHSSVSPLKIKLPKKSKVYLHADTINCNAIKIFSDTDATGTVTGDVYAALDECESVFIQSALSPQFILNKFMYWLKTHGAADLDGAINYCTGGLFTSKDDVISSFLSDLDNFSNFLRNYCGVNLDNEDTGAAIGSDAGGGYSKNAETIVPEPVPVEDWILPEKGSSKEIEGLTVYFPSSGVHGNFTDAEKHILAGLNSVWIEQALILIRKSCGLTFINWSSEAIFPESINVKFVYEQNNRLAYVSAKYSGSRASELTLCINMYAYEVVDKTSVDGAAHSLVHLDRTLAHELTHAVMAASIVNYSDLPLFIKEGAAELIHGIDDTDTDLIRYLLQSGLRSRLESIFNTGGDAGDRYVYIAGYLFFRYLIKQTIARGNVSPTNATVYNLSISDSAVDYSGEALTDNTRQFLYPDITRTLVNTYDIFFDVALLSTVPVELFVDLQRTIITKLSLFPTNNADYFSGGGSTAITLPSQEVIPSAAGNTSGLQSIEITLAEQQLTDQVTVTGIIPFDIMGGVNGTYLDYDYDMCVEGVTQQGALYTADCCSGVDELLYTQINYSLSSGFTYFAPDYEEMTLSIINTPSDGDEVPEGTIRKGKASAHLKQIADALDKDCVCQFEDFISEINERQEDVTYNDIISQLFGWTSRLPQRMINVFIRDDTLFAVQRGQEKKTLDITGANYPYPTIEKKLMRTMWGSGKFGITPQTKEENADNRQLIGGIRVYPWPPTTSADGKTKYIYHDVTGYAGVDGNGYALQQTETKNNDGGRTIVTYIYSIVQGIYTCVAEESKTYDGEGKKVDEHKIIHDRLTRSQEFSRMEDEDGNTLASNVSSNLPGFYNESYVLQKPYEIGSEKTYQMISGYNRLVDSNFPVCDPDIYPKLIEAYAWLNRKTQETVKLDIYNYPHLIDFNDKIVLNGKEYFLVSNTAITTPHIFNRQSISIVRWY